jgi:hypothetical protein
LFRRNRSSALRYCQTAAELPFSSLWGRHGFQLAIAQVQRFFRTDDERWPSASAIGVVHEIYGSGHPVLPVEIEFDLSNRHEKFSGGGEVDLLGDHGAVRFYEARIFINDPGGVIFSAFERALKHAAISGNQFAHLTLRRDREPPSNFDGIADHKATVAEIDRLRELMDGVDTGKASLPRIEFNGLSFDDTIRTKAPLWGDSWHEASGLLRPSFLDPETAKWCDAQKRYRKK